MSSEKPINKENFFIISKPDIKKRPGPFWPMFIIYLILGLVMLILTAMVLKEGSHQKILLWILYAISIFLFIVTLMAMYSKNHRFIAAILMFFQFLANLFVLILTDQYGNVARCDILTHTASAGMYTWAVSFTLLSLFAGIAVVYFDHDIEVK